MNVHVRLLAILLSFDILLIFTSGLLRVAVIGGYLAETPTFLNIGRDWRVVSCIWWKFPGGVLLACEVASGQAA
ncbi:hypothetical protein, partial [uncultured Jannaschia sp.]|uniref:hypothetical protein n=1 Tax=uncultured Jannaschia sp. TaxID=293347 RepID=UPI0026232C7C